MVRATRIATTALAVAALTAGGCGGRQAAPPATAPAGARAVIDTDVRPAGHGFVRWSSRWKLAWDEVPGAREYIVYLGTSEGTGETQRVGEPHWALDVANGENRRSALPKARDQQLALVAAQLTVAIAARYPDGRIGPKTQAMPVGEPVG